MKRDDLLLKINDCEWPTTFSNPVKEGISDFEDSLDYFQQLSESSDISEIVENPPRFGYMAPALTFDGLLYLLPKLLLESIKDLDSELTTGLLNVICDFSNEFEGLLSYGKITDEQYKCIQMYLKFFLENNKESVLHDSVLSYFIDSNY